MFQDSVSPLMYHISSFHDHVMVVVLMIISMVMYMLCSMVLFPLLSRFIFSSEGLEIFWTVLPCLVLASLAIPSLFALYLIEETVKPLVSIKVIGHQWFWSYEYEDFEHLEYDSYLIPVDSMEKIGESRLLEVDKNVVVPSLNQIRLMISSSDVIHSWTVPSLGVKVDAVPGRLNQVNLFCNRTGLFFGQCSEICGSLHSFMPICVESVPFNNFLDYIKNF